MSTIIGIMKEGVLQQLDTPDQDLPFPSQSFCGRFHWQPKGQSCWMVLLAVKTNLFKLVISDVQWHTILPGNDDGCAVRPEDIIFLTEPEPDAVEFSAYSVLPAGADSTIIARRGKTEITIKVMGISKIEMDQKIWLKFDSRQLEFV